MNTSILPISNITQNDTRLVNIPEVPSAWQIVIMYIVATGAFINNMTVFYTVPRLRGKIKSSTRYAMLNLAITDALLGFGCLVARTVYLINPRAFLDHLCRIDGLFNPFLASMSVLGLTFLNLDKFLTLQFPLHYKIWMTRRKTFGILLGIWLFFLIFYACVLAPGQVRVRYLENTFVCIVNYADNETFSIIGIVLLQALPLCICVVSLIGMYRILKSYQSRATVLQEGQRTVSKNDHTIVFTIFVLTFVYFVMCTPFFVCVLIWELFTGSTLGPNSNFFTTWLGGANSALNPLIYIPSMRSYRKELKRGFDILFRKEEPQLQHQTTFDSSIGL